MPGPAQQDKQRRSRKSNLSEGETPGSWELWERLVDWENNELLGANTVDKIYAEGLEDRILNTLTAKE